MANYPNRSNGQRSGGQQNYAPPKAAQLDYPKTAEEYGIDKPLWFALRNMYPGGQDNSIVMVYEYCKARGLDPLKKPVHIVPMKVKNTAGGYEMRDVIMPGIQELRTTAARTREFAGIDPPKFGPVIEVPVKTKGNDQERQSAGLIRVPEWCEITVNRLVAGKKYPFTHIEYFEECVARNGGGEINDMWSKRSRGQMAKCAEAGALRKAFPEELGGEYAAEEIEGQTLDLPELQGLPGAVPETGASGVPGPEELPTPASAGAAAPLVTSETDDPSITRADAPADVADGAAPTEQAQQDEAPVLTFAVKIEGGALRIFHKHLQDKGITEAQFLARFGRDVETSNINEALGTIRTWS